MNDQPTSPPPAGMTADQLLCCALDVAGQTLKCGGDIRRVEETVTRICQSYGAAHVEVSAITSMIHATVRLPDGSMSSQMRRIRVSDNDLGQLERCNALSRTICAERPDYDTLQQRIRTLKARSVIPLPAQLLGAALSAGGFAVYFGGSWLDGVSAALIAACMMLLGRYCLPFANQFARTLMMSLFGGLAAVAICAIGQGCHSDKIMIGTIMCIIPGLALGTALRDLLSDDTLSGVIRLIRALLLAVVIALGYTAGMLVTGESGGLSYELNTPLWQTLMALIGPLGTCLLFRIPKGRILPALLGSLAASLVCMGVRTFIDGDFFPSLFSTVVVCCYAQLLARRFRFPAMVVSTIAVLPLLPGSLLYYTMHHLMVRHWETALFFGERTISTALGIAAGEVAVGLISLALSDRRKKRNTPAHTEIPSNKGEPT